MKFLVFAVSTLAAVLAVRDPTTVCTPDMYEISFYDFNSNDYGMAALDYTKNMSAVTFMKSGLRAVYDLTAMKGYLIAGTGVCTTFVMDPVQVVVKCLPATAKPITNMTVMIGMADKGGINIVSYDVPLTATDIVRVAFTDTTPAFPVLRELIGSKSTVTGDVLFFTNPVVSTTSSSMLTIPSMCTPTMPVG